MRRHHESIVLGLALLAAASPAAAQKKATPRASAPTSRFAIVPTLGAMSPAAEAADERRAHMRADAMRADILRAARWAPLEDDGCESGALRTFADDTTLTARNRADSAQQIVAQLEFLVIARGIDEPLTTPAARDLMATVVAWESGAKPPTWDAAAGEPERHAIAAGLSGRVRNPVTNACDRAVAIDTVRVLAPGVTGVAVPRSAPQPVVVYSAPAALDAVRTRVLASRPRAGEPFATLYYVRVRTAVVWGDYAVVSVEREGDREAGAPPASTAGGAAYLFHRVNGAWRLLAVPRTWA